MQGSYLVFETGLQSIGDLFVESSYLVRERVIMSLAKPDQSSNSTATLKPARLPEMLLLVRGRSPWYQSLSLLQALFPLNPHGV